LNRRLNVATDQYNVFLAQPISTERGFVDVAFYRQFVVFRLVVSSAFLKYIKMSVRNTQKYLKHTHNTIKSNITLILQLTAGRLTN